MYQSPGHFLFHKEEEKESGSHHAAGSGESPLAHAVRLGAVDVRNLVHGVHEGAATAANQVLDRAGLDDDRIAEPAL